MNGDAARPTTERSAQARTENGGTDVFPDTSVTMLEAIQDAGGETSRLAFDRFAEAYREPLVRFTRSRGLDEEDAEDVVQQFFLDVLIRRRALHQLNTQKWRLRRFLRVAVTRFIYTYQRKQMSQKRGGDLHHTTLREQDLPPRRSEEVILEFERAWAGAIMERVYKRLRQKFRRPDREAYYDTLEACIPWRSGEAPLGDIALEFGMREEAVKGQLKRIRDTYRQFLYEEVCRTVPKPEEVNDELRHLAKVLQSAPATGMDDPTPP